MIAGASLFLLGWLAGLGTYWAWVIVDFHWHRTRKFYE